MDPCTGRVLALAGGFSFDESQFNRATQAMRQPGSSFKPFVYSAALDNGYTPSSVILDAPFELAQAGQETWRPENYSGKFYGPQTLRFGLEQSRNVMTVRLANDLGMPTVVQYAKNFGIYDNLLPVLSMALGAGETTVFKMVSGYSMIANGGKRIKPTLIDRIQDRYGKTIYKHDERECRGCDADKWTNQPEPTLIDRREQVLDPMTAYQITSMMEGVVQRGTGTALKVLGKPIAGKTGTTNDEKDAWFIGFTPDIVVGVYLGFDTPKPMGKGSTGGVIAAPVVRDFLAGGDRRPSRGAVPRAAGHQADPHQPEDRPACRAGRQCDPGSLQARHRAARQLFGDRLRRRLDERDPGSRPRRRQQRHRRAVLRSLCANILRGPAMRAPQDRRCS